MRLGRHGETGHFVIAIHGGPGAPGGLTPVADGLSDSFRVLEPWQRGSGGEPLTVARHVADLRDLITAECPGERPALLGASWGAMLALAFAAAHPSLAGPLVLVGCGTFDRAARARMHELLAERLGQPIAALQARIAVEPADPDASLAALANALAPAYDFDATPSPTLSVDARANAETWADMLRLQDAGIYPAAFAAIRSPVLMLHGAFDPHPGEMIRESLRAFLPRLKYHEWERCGHEPWRERAVREDFFVRVRDWLQARGES